jgi:hypothetical protein
MAGASRGFAPGTATTQPRRNDARVVDHEDVSGAQQARQVGDPPVGQATRLVPAGFYDEQPRRIPGPRRMQRDAIGRQVEIEGIDAGHRVGDRPLASGSGQGRASWQAAWRHGDPASPLDRVAAARSP